MKIDKKKLERQLIGVHRWFHSSMYGASKDKQGAAVYVTGFGKTYVAILVIKRLFRENVKTNIVLIVPANVLSQWQDVLDREFLKKELVFIHLFTPHSIVNNNTRINTDVLIVDELHECYSTEFIKVIDKTYIRYKHNLGLTGTYKDSKNRHKQVEDIFPIIDTIEEEEGIREGYISPYIEYNLAIKLTEEEQEQYQKFTDMISETINKFPQGIQLKVATQCLSGGKHTDGRTYTAAQYVYGYAASKGWRKDLDTSDPTNRLIDNLWNPHKIFGYAQKLLNSIRNRKNLLYNSENKVTACLEIAQKFKGIKTIIFSQSTAFADKVDFLLNEIDPNFSVVYHSSLQTIMLPSPVSGKLIKFGKTRLKRMAIEKIKNGEATVITTASSLDKGFDVQDLGIGLTASGTSNFTQYKQRSGRTKRVDLFNNEKLALLINLYVKDTVEEGWLNKRQSESTNAIHWINTIEEITFTLIIKDDININEI